MRLSHNRHLLEHHNLMEFLKREIDPIGYDMVHN
jgi:hypothetical protein